MYFNRFLNIKKSFLPAQCLSVSLPTVTIINRVLHPKMVNKKRRWGPIAIMRHGATIPIHLLNNLNQEKNSIFLSFLFFSFFFIFHSLITSFHILFTCWPHYSQIPRRFIRSDMPAPPF